MVVKNGIIGTTKERSIEAIFNHASNSKMDFKWEETRKSNVRVGFDLGICAKITIYCIKMSAKIRQLSKRKHVIVISIEPENRKFM